MHVQLIMGTGFLQPLQTPRSGRICEAQLQRLLCYVALALGDLFVQREDTTLKRGLSSHD